MAGKSVRLGSLISLFDKEDKLISSLRVKDVYLNEADWSEAFIKYVIVDGKDTGRNDMILASTFANWMDTTNGRIEIE